MSTFCMRCGSSMDDQDQFCRKCGAQASALAESASVTTIPAGPAQTSGKAIASLVCGLLFFVPFAFVPAVIFGHLGLSEIRKSAGRLKGDGLAMAGLVLGYIWIVSIPIIILIIAAIAIPNVMHARVAANEGMAVSSIRSINTAQMSYSESHPETGYTCSLSALTETQMIDSTLASGQKSGYRFEIMACAAEPLGGPNKKYQVVAYPITVNQTGDRSFCSDESAVIKRHSGGSAQHCLESGAVFQ